MKSSFILSFSLFCCSFLTNAQNNNTFPTTPITIKVGDIAFNMMPVEGGILDRNTSNVPIESFYIGETEVTQALWEEVMKNNPSTSNVIPSFPVETISWEDAKIFIAKLDTLTGMTFRLPSEREWEYAAKGGNKSNNFKYSGSNKIDEIGWYKINSGDKTNPVGKKKPNELGIYDMIGNVEEWCEDIFISIKQDIEGNDASRNSSLTTRYAEIEVKSQNTKNHVLRGGSWNDRANHSKLTSRKGSDFGNDKTGLRLCLTPSKN